MKHITPTEAYELQRSNPDALLIDVRSEIEYLFVGHPVGAIHVSWNDGPDWEVNPNFIGEVKKLAGSGGFIWLFGPAVIGMMLGSVLSERVAGRWSQIRTVATGFAVMFAAVALNLAVSGLLPAGVPQSVLPIGLFACGMSIAMPAMSLLALELFPARRGMASSCQSFLQIGLNAVTAGMTAPLLWGSTFSLASGMALFAAAGLCAWLLWLRLPAARR